MRFFHVGDRTKGVVVGVAYVAAVATAWSSVTPVVDGLQDSFATERAISFLLVWLAGVFFSLPVAMFAGGLVDARIRRHVATLVAVAVATAIPDALPPAWVARPEAG